mmetsp:Transcript_15581/g.38593  ORF Transcript_15581/g.38593 Transcript_15581/m.38593 type:complete len:213 (-) Transcript_15581:1424-2062(-)
MPTTASSACTTWSASVTSTFNTWLPSPPLPSPSPSSSDEDNDATATVELSLNLIGADESSAVVVGTVVLAAVLTAAITAASVCSTTRSTTALPPPSPPPLLSLLLTLQCASSPSSTPAATTSPLLLNMPPTPLPLPLPRRDTITSAAATNVVSSRGSATVCNRSHGTTCLLTSTYCNTVSSNNSSSTFSSCVSCERRSVSEITSTTIATTGR